MLLLWLNLLYDIFPIFFGFLLRIINDAIYFLVLLVINLFDLGKYKSEYSNKIKSKKETADYLRSMLMALSSMPLTPAEKIADKQQELDTIMSDIQHLEIKIQKAKMEKKA